jgi:UDP-N-acetyl-D-galactosamine dehydrogenase
MHKSKQLGHDPQVIAAGRRVNNYIPSFIAKRLVTTLIDSGKSPIECKVLVMGITFKEDVSDIRNSKVADLIGEIIDFSVKVDVIDVHASKEEVFHEYKIDLKEGVDDDYDAIVLAVGHKEYKEMSKSDFEKLSKSNIILFDIKGVVKHLGIQNYWKL